MACVYKAMEELGQMFQITNTEQLNAHLELWKTSNTKKPIGYILSLEGADSIITINHLERSFEQGLRAIGPAHYGPGTYAQGTDSKGEIGAKGKDLLKEIERLNLILDATHLSDESFWETMKIFKGPVWASHNNCRKFVPHNRQYSDEQIIDKLEGEYDAIVLTVAHECFKEINLQNISHDGTVIYDIKYAFDKEIIDGRL